MAADKSLARPD